ncbi:hypothetical protein [Methylocystis hirsuta]|uniref:hypothetical protein n=1 Tax=Methylocystis hirsuta TaxID=369798 RepID=UPI001FDEB441|nr:hypothetical protein [Methylocystis hirsuta]
MRLSGNKTHDARKPPLGEKGQTEQLQDRRFLQGDNRDQERMAPLREAIRKHQHIEVTLRNYRKNGELFFNKPNIPPLLDSSGAAIYYLGDQYDVTKLVRAEAEIDRLGQRLKAGEGVSPYPFPAFLL